MVVSLLATQEQHLENLIVSAPKSLSLRVLSTHVVVDAAISDTSSNDLVGNGINFTGDPVGDGVTLRML